MRTKEQLERVLEELQLDCYETLSDITEERAVQMLGFEELCSFAKRKNIDTVFYYFDYIKAEELQIDDVVIRKLNIDGEMIEVAQTGFDDYNESVLELDYSRPYRLITYCLYQNFALYAVEEDLWFEEMGFGNPYIAANRILNELSNAIIEKKKISDSIRMEKREQLKKRILQDEEFARCTNQQLRRVYASKLFKDREVQELFYAPLYGNYDIRISDFVEDIWREHKAMR